MSAPTRVWVEGVGMLDVALGMAALDGFELSPPRARTRFVDVPGRDGRLDLTGAMGGTRYEDRVMTLRFQLTGDPEEAKGRMLSALHGRRLRFQLTVDPDHTYEGRWDVSQTSEHHGDGATVVTCEVTCDPYRHRRNERKRVNAVGGHWFHFDGGDRPVRPIIRCSTPTWVQTRDGRVSRFNPGGWRMNDVLFTRGQNWLYVNSWTLRDTKWGYVASDGPRPLKWGDLRGKTWGDLARLSSSDGVAPRRWADLRGTSWGDLRGMAWGDLKWKPKDGGDELPVDTTVIIEWEMGDL